jgi:hypothetical protein
MTTTNHSAPHDVWCSECDANVGPAGCFVHGIGAQIPVYAEIPEGDRPAAAPPGRGALIANFDSGLGCDRWMHVVGSRRDALRQNGQWFAYGWVDGVFCQVAKLADFDAAVAWVAEGKR